MFFKGRGCNIYGSFIYSGFELEVIGCLLGVEGIYVWWYVGILGYFIIMRMNSL